MKPFEAYFFYGASPYRATPHSLRHAPPFTEDTAALKEAYRRWTKKYCGWGIPIDKVKVGNGWAYAEGNGFQVYFGDADAYHNEIGIPEGSTI